MHCFRVGPFGKSPDPSPPRRIVVIREDGTEEVHVHLGFDDSIYFLEAVYTVDGVPYPADIFLDRPEDESMVIWVDPHDPREFASELPGYGLSVLLLAGAVGLAIAALA